jgi:predicted glycoside hydrolase/deacetylase ChbG (UPF0249 family)
MKYLIVTADDLGLTKSINEGIAGACRDGVVTAVSVIPTGDAVDDALGLIKELPFKDIGAHLSLSETGPLLASSRHYRSYKELFFDMVFGRVSAEGLYNELKAQMEALKKSGFKITHISSHENVHMIPKVLGIFIRVAKEYGIPAIRFPRGDRPVRAVSVKDNYRKMVLDHFAPSMESALSSSGLIFTNHFFGLLDSGCLDIEKINGIVKTMKDGVSELVTHPGFLGPEVMGRYSWHIGAETELFALTDKSVKRTIAENGVKLIGFEEFVKMR